MYAVTNEPIRNYAAEFIDNLVEKVKNIEYIGLFQGRRTVCNINNGELYIQRDNGKYVPMNIKEQQKCYHILG